MSFEEAFQSMGAAMDDAFSQLGPAVESAMMSLSRLHEELSIATKPYTQEARDLTEDMAEEHYTMVERGHVRVTEDEGIAVCEYDGEEFRRYDLSKVRKN